MKSPRRDLGFILAAIFILGSRMECGAALEGSFRLEETYFPQSAGWPGQPSHFNGSMASDPGFSWKLNPTASFRAIAFGRVDEHDSHRSHFDLREFRLQWTPGSWTADLGWNRVFWGVVESRHLVDVVNQMDWVEDAMGEEKLGQPMAALAYNHPVLGHVDLLLMSDFRLRTFPGASGRPGLPIPVLQDEPRFESSLGRWHPDAALRWAGHRGEMDWGLSWFYGTTRDPQLQMTLDAGRPALRPYYTLSDQAGLELQWTTGAWIWKLEAMSRQGQGPWFAAATGGWEYTLANLFQSGSDLSPFLEYSYDGRKVPVFNVFDNDVFAGLRWARNDGGDMQLKCGTLVDLESGSIFASLEINRRYVENWKLKLKGQTILAEDSRDFLWNFRRDENIRAEADYSF